MQKMDPAVSRRFTWMKSIMCVLVIYVHCRNTDYFDVSTAPQIADLENRLCEIFAICAVPVFFFLSGYLFFRNYRPDQLLRKWKSRLFTLVIPFIVWNLLYYVFEMLLRVLPFTAGAFAGTTVPFNFRELLAAAFNCKYLPVFWFMQYLIIYTILAPALWFLLKKRIPGLITVLVVFAAVAASGYLPNMGEPPFLLMLTHYFPGYLAGAYIAIHFGELFEYRRITAWKASVCLILSAGLIIWQLKAPSFLSLELLRLLIGILLWFSLGAIPFPEPARWTNYLFFLYAAHLMIAKLVNLAVCIKVSNHMIVGGIVWVILPVLIIIICTAVGTFFTRFLPHTAAVLGISRTNRKVPPKS